MMIGNLSFAFLGEFLGVCAWGLFFLCGWGGMEGGTNGQSASGAAAWSCLVRSFRRVILVHRFRNNNTTHLSVNPIAQV